MLAALSMLSVIFEIVDNVHREKSNMAVTKHATWRFMWVRKVSLILITVIR